MEKKTRKTPMTHEELKAAKRDWYHKNAEAEREKQRKRYKAKAKTKIVKEFVLPTTTGKTIHVPPGHFTY